MKPKITSKPDLPAACFDGLADEHIEQMLNTAEYITRLYVTSFRESARLLAQLHDEVPEGNWLAFLDSGALPFNRRTAQDLCSAWSWLKDCNLSDQQLAGAFRSKRALAKVAIAEEDVREVIEAKVLAGEQITEATVNAVRRKSIPVASTQQPEKPNLAKALDLLAQAEARKKDTDVIDVEVIDPRDAELEQLRAENARLKDELKALTLNRIDTTVEEGQQRQAETEQAFTEMEPAVELESRTFYWYLERSMSMKQAFPFVERLMAEITAAGATYEQPGSMDPERWQKVYAFVNPFFDEVDRLAEMEEALGLDQSDDNDAEHA